MGTKPRDIILNLATTPGSTTSSFVYTAPDTQVGTVTYSTDPNFITGVSTLADSGGVSPRNVLATSLSVGTTYYYHVDAGYSARTYGTFTTTGGAPTCVITTTSLPAAVLNQAYSQTIGTTGCGATTFTVTAGALPGWASLNASTGAITGTATPIGTSSFTIGVADGGGNCNPSDNNGTCSQMLSITTSGLPSVEFHGVVRIGP